MRFMCCSLSAGGVRRSAADSPDWKFGLIHTVVTRTSSLTSFAGHTGTRGIPGTATPRVNRGDSSIPNPGRSSPRPRRSATVYLDFRRSITMLTCSPSVLGLSLSSGDPLQRHPNGVVNRTLGGLPCGCMFPRLDDVDSTTPPGPSRWPVLPQAPNSEPRVCMDSVARAREKGIPPNGWWSSPGLFDDLELAAGTGGQVFEPRQNRRFVPPGWEPGLRAGFSVSRRVSGRAGPCGGAGRSVGRSGRAAGRGGGRDPDLAASVVRRAEGLPRGSG